jgi:hypothetical protein
VGKRADHGESTTSAAFRLLQPIHRHIRKIGEERIDLRFVKSSRMSSSDLPMPSTTFASSAKSILLHLASICLSISDHLGSTVSRIYFRRFSV